MKGSKAICSDFTNYWTKAKYLIKYDIVNYSNMEDWRRSEEAGESHMTRRLLSWEFGGCVSIWKLSNTGESVR